MKKNWLITFTLVAFSTVCTYFATVSTAQQGNVPLVTAGNYEYQVGAVLYMQKAAEYRALCYQAFNWAKMGLDLDEKNKKKLPKPERKKPRAVIVDIDETMLDNSPAQAAGIKNNQPFSYSSWYGWGKMQKAKAIPGAVDFANFAKSKGVRIFYISNRDKDPQLQDTIENLKNVGFPDISEDNVLLRIKDGNGKNISTKTPRREFVAQNYRVVFLLGDNLNDFSDVFEGKSTDTRYAETDKAKDWWGTKYIALPNAMYGEWENAVYDYDFKLTEAQKAEKRINSLQLP
ncbi:MAG: 5'-nucleotidase, lipoprotein e(P4) family [Pyrinomonadaceae bacterium]|nr:5'-nucleotidase, lipoprotein e(P4) family [Pyrinomonadaceae bacterium]